MIYKRGFLQIYTESLIVPMHLGPHEEYVAGQQPSKCVRRLNELGVLAWAAVSTGGSGGRQRAASKPLGRGV